MQHCSTLLFKQIKTSLGNSLNNVHSCILPDEPPPAHAVASCS